jgi:putative ABC transport system substrate-binding protein
MSTHLWRRQFLASGVALIGGTLLAGCGRLPGAAHRAPEAARIGFLVSTTGPYIGSPTAVFEAFRRGLRELRYVEGRGLTLELRSAQDRGQLDALAAELVGLGLDLLVAAGVASFAARTVSDRVPVVFGFSGDPVEADFVDSLARPGRNMTGMTFLGDELVGKRLQLLKQAAAAISRVGVLAFPGHPGEQHEWQTTQMAAQDLGLAVQRFEVSSSADVQQALEAIRRRPVDALVAFPDSITLADRDRIAAVALERRLPSVFGWREYTEAGGLLSYGPKLEDSWSRVALYVDKLLKGAKPADLPVERPRTFELVANLRTARQIGLSLPQDVLLQVDDLIE